MKHQKLAIALFTLALPASAIDAYAAVTASGQTKVVSICDDLSLSMTIKNSRPTTVRLAGIVMPDESCDLADCISEQVATKKVQELKPLLGQWLVDNTVRWEICDSRHGGGTRNLCEEKLTVLLVQPSRKDRKYPSLAKLHLFQRPRPVAHYHYNQCRPYERTH
ncbi:MAG: hypothetical protein ING75_17325 [Rhodocyclaceae bacterium]|nr:hypothetical protein [Rhodocyclaceae bacterium]